MDPLERILGRLLAAGVEFVVIGGYAAVVHGAIDVTRDIDICCRFSGENLLRLGTALEPIHARHRLTLHEAPLDLRPGNLAGWRNFYLATDDGVLDCLSEVLGVGDFDAVLAGSVLVAGTCGEFRVLDIPTLILAKEAIARPHDLRTVIQLRCVLEVQAAKLDPQL